MRHFAYLLTVLAGCIYVHHASARTVNIMASQCNLVSGDMYCQADQIPMSEGFYDADIPASKKESFDRDCLNKICNVTITTDDKGPVIKNIINIKWILSEYGSKEEYDYVKKN
nr:hypothetical protein [uncultured Neokomagataea sp.]